MNKNYKKTLAIGLAALMIGTATMPTSNFSGKNSTSAKTSKISKNSATVPTKETNPDWWKKPLIWTTAVASTGGIGTALYFGVKKLLSTKTRKINVGFIIDTVKYPFLNSGAPRLSEFSSDLKNEKTFKDIILNNIKEMHAKYLENKPFNVGVKNILTTNDITQTNFNNKLEIFIQNITNYLKINNEKDITIILSDKQINYNDYLNFKKPANSNNNNNNNNNNNKKNSVVHVDKKNRFVGIHNVKNMCFCISLIQLLYRNKALRKKLNDTFEHNFDPASYKFKIKNAMYNGNDSVAYVLYQMFDSMDYSIINPNNNTYCLMTELVEKLYANLKIHGHNYSTKIPDDSGMLFNHVFYAVHDEFNRDNNNDTLMEDSIFECMPIHKKNPNLPFINCSVSNGSTVYDVLMKGYHDNNEYPSKLRNNLFVRIHRNKPWGSSEKLFNECKFEEFQEFYEYDDVKIKRSVNYQLMGVVMNSGSSLNGGHFYVYIRGDDKNWFCCDDSIIKEITTEDDIKEMKLDWFCTPHVVDPELLKHIPDGLDNNPKSAFMLWYEKVDVAQ